MFNTNLRHIRDVLVGMVWASVHLLAVVLLLSGSLALIKIMVSWLLFTC